VLSSFFAISILSFSLFYFLFYSLSLIILLFFFNFSSSLYYYYFICPNSSFALIVSLNALFLSNILVYSLNDNELLWDIFSPSFNYSWFTISDSSIFKSFILPLSSSSSLFSSYIAFYVLTLSIFGDIVCNDSTPLPLF
jgi:hypothetical protein